MTATFDELLAAHENEGLPVYLVTGRRVREPYLDTWTGRWRTGTAEGSDGEPLLRDVRIVCKLSIADVWFAPSMQGFEENYAAVSSGCNPRTASAKIKRRKRG